jgi:hypothetical protein
LDPTRGKKQESLRTSLRVDSLSQLTLQNQLQLQLLMQRQRLRRRKKLLKEMPILNFIRRSRKRR